MPDSSNFVCALDSSDFVCALCFDVVGVPAQLAVCDCKTLYCLHCLRDMIGLNGKPRTHAACPTCRKQLPKNGNAATYYTRARDLEQTLDNALGPMSCPRECGASFYRTAFDNHTKECPKTRKFCTECKQYYVGTASGHYTICPKITAHKILIPITPQASINVQNNCVHLPN